MKIGKLAVWLLAAVPLLQGCKNFWNTPTSSGGGGTGASGGYFYVLNQKTSQLAGFSIVKGTITAVSKSPYSLGAVPFSLAISPNNGYLYVGTAAGIYIYNIATDGSLTIGNSGAAISGDPAYTMEVDSTGSWLVEAVSGAGALNAIPLVSTTGLEDKSSSEKSVALPSLSLQQLALSPGSSSSPYVFVAMGSGGTAVVPFTAANADPFGSVSRIAVKNSAGGANTVAVDPSNRLLYVGETVAVSGTQTGGVRVFTIGSTSISEISGSPYATAGTGPSSILATTDRVYVANRSVSGSSNGNITGFSITTTGSVFSLTSISTVAAGTGTSGIAEENTGNYVLAVNSSGSPDLNAYTFDTTTTGKLDSATTSTTGTDPVTAIAVAAQH